MRKLLSAVLLLFVLALPALAAVDPPPPFNDFYRGPTAFTATGTLTIPTQGLGTVTVQATGTGSGLAFSFQGSNDKGVTWQTLQGFVPSTGAAGSSFSANGIWQVPVAGFSTLRVNLTAIGGGTETFTLEGSAANCAICGGLPAGITITQTRITLTAATSATLIAANTSRRYLCWENTGTAPVTIAPGLVTVTAGQGWNLDPGSSAINQGGSFCQESSSISRQAFSAISTAGTTVVVWEGQ